MQIASGSNRQTFVTYLATNSATVINTIAGVTACTFKQPRQTITFVDMLTLELLLVMPPANSWLNAKRRMKGHLCNVSAETMDRRYWAEHRFSMVLIEVMVNATDDDPTLPDGLELVLSDGDSFPITSTCCPR
jgi:hypothetical protein